MVRADIIKRVNVTCKIDNIRSDKRRTTGSIIFDVLKCILTEHATIEFKYVSTKPALFLQKKNAVFSE